MFVATYVKVLAVGVVIGFLGGAFGRGGSAVATPLLQLAGLPAMFALASPARRHSFDAGGQRRLLPEGLL